MNISRGALFLVLAIKAVPALAADGVPSSFQRYVPYVLGDYDASGTVYLAPELSGDARTTASGVPDTYLVLSVTLPNAAVIELEFDPGPSEDPAFVTRINGSEAASIGGRVLYVSAAGALYSITNSNDYFERARKFRIVGNAVEEVVQPFYLVDNVCVTSTVLTMYTGRCDTGQPVATLPRDSEVRVLLAEFGEASCNGGTISDNTTGDPVMAFLVVTPFGLTGWVASTAGYLDRPGRPLSCIVFHGD